MAWSTGRSPAGSFPLPPQEASAAPGAEGLREPFRRNPPATSAILEGTGLGPICPGDWPTTGEGLGLQRRLGTEVLGVPGLSLTVAWFWDFQAFLLPKIS